jgi:AraC family transcriptional regulator of arabinose operon
MSIKEERKRARKRAGKKTSKRANSESLRIDQPHVAPESTIRDPRVQTVIDFLNANLHRSVRLNEIAETATLSPSRLSHVFKDEMGISPGKYLRRIRIQKASSLLATSRLSVKQIMAMAGYDNKSHFVRQFRKEFHITPSEYRKLRQPDSKKRARLLEE